RYTRIQAKLGVTLSVPKLWNKWQTPPQICQQRNNVFLWAIGFLCKTVPKILKTLGHLVHYCHVEQSFRSWLPRRYFKMGEELACKTIALYLVNAVQVSHLSC